MLAHAIRWSNDLVMAFDGSGKQIDALNGRYGDVKQAVIDEATAATVFQHGDWNTRHLATVPMEEW